MVCRECGRELTEAGVGRPRSYCSVTCRQRAYRRRKAEAWSGKDAYGGETSPPEPQPGDRGRSATAEAIMIRVHLTEGTPGGEAVEGATVSAADADWRTLDELARTALLLARRLREQKDAEERAAEAGGNQSGELDLTATAVAVSDLLEDEHQDDRERAGTEVDVPGARDSPEP